MSLLWVSLASVIVAALTLFSGFGLGTLLMPVFALFFPLEVAVGATAIVHLANSLFKLWTSRQARLLARGHPLRDSRNSGCLPGRVPAVLCFATGTDRPLSPRQPQSGGHLDRPDHRSSDRCLCPIRVDSVLRRAPIRQALAAARRLPLGTVWRIVGPPGRVAVGLHSAVGPLEGRRSWAPTSFAPWPWISRGWLSTVWRLSSAVQGRWMIRPSFPLLTTATLAAFVGSFLGAKLLPRCNDDFRAPARRRAVAPARSRHRVRTGLNPTAVGHVFSKAAQLSLRGARL